LAGTLEAEMAALEATCRYLACERLNDLQISSVLHLIRDRGHCAV